MCTVGDKKKDDEGLKSMGRGGPQLMPLLLRFDVFVESYSMIVRHHEGIVAS